MSITVTGRKTTVTPSLKAYVDEKIGRSLEVFEAAAMDAEVVLRVGHNPANPISHTCEVTLYAKGAVIRVSESADNMYAAIDAASDKVARQLRKYKTRVIDRRQRAAAVREVSETDLADLIVPAEPQQPAEEEEEQEEILREKLIEFTPLTVDQALLQTDLLGHDFFVFTNVETGDVNVIYRRKNGGYGILKPVAPAPAYAE